MVIEIALSKDVDKKEFSKVIGFISDKIISYQFDEDRLMVSLAEEQNSEEIKGKILSLSKQYVIKKEEIYSENRNDRVYYEFKNGSIENAIYQFENGMISLQGKSIFLYNYFNHVFETFALKAGAEKKMYPVLLPVDAYQKTGYLKNSPQYAMFCSCSVESMDVLEKMNDNALNHEINKMLREPAYALSPSACFHTYLEYKNQTLPKEQVVTFTQSVFRNEGRFNFEELGRLRDYHVREIVFIGSVEYVEKQRQEIMDQTIHFLESLNMDYDITVANDAFVMPKMQKFKKIQKLSKTKYELHLFHNEIDKMSVASFNLHGTAFTYPFHIKVEGCENTVTGCIGYGLERWVISFIKQYGLDIEKWPKEVKTAYQKLNNEFN